MVSHPSLLVALKQLVDKIPAPPRPRARGRPPVYSDRLFLKALVIMIVRYLAAVGALPAILEQPTPEMQQLRSLLTDAGHYPSCGTRERRLNTIPATLPAQIGCWGRHLVVLLRPGTGAGEQQRWTAPS